MAEVRLLRRSRLMPRTIPRFTSKEFFRMSMAAMLFASGDSFWHVLSPMILSTPKTFRMKPSACFISFCGSALSVPISVVVLLCTGKQVIGIAARRVVAAVQYPQTLRDRTIGQYIRNAVSARTPTVYPHSSIPTLLVWPGLPRPALIGLSLIYLRPKSVCECLGFYARILISHINSFTVGLVLGRRMTTRILTAL